MVTDKLLVLSLVDVDGKLVVVVWTFFGLLLEEADLSLGVVAVDDIVKSFLVVDWLLVTIFGVVKVLVEAVWLVA